MGRLRVRALSLIAVAAVALGAAGCKKPKKKDPLAPQTPISISSLTPITGPTGGGTVVTVSGQGFTGTSGNVDIVGFGGISATTLTVLSETTLTATTPAHAAGVVDVVVGRSASGELVTEVGGFQYVSGPMAGPLLFGISPSVGPTTGGTLVTVTGIGFQVGATITIGGSAATSVTVLTGGRLTAVTPAGTAGPANVVITNPDLGATSLTNGFTYQPTTGPNPAPTIAWVAPSLGYPPGGEIVTVVGTNFYGTPGVTFGAAAATNVVVISAAAIRVTSPAGSIGFVNVTVTNPDSQSATLTNGYRYTLPAPVVTASIPPSGTAGTLLTIYGSNFQTGATAYLALSSPLGSPSVNGAGTQLTGTVPLFFSPGTMDVTVVNPDGRSGRLTNAFTYVTSGTNPTISSLSPTFGNPSGGTVVTITGTNFSTTGTTQVWFGSSPATSVTVLNSTTITVVAPGGTLGSTVNVAVTNPSGLSTTSVGSFQYVAGPTVSSMTPTTGNSSGGTVVTITGTGFRTGATVLIGSSFLATGVTVVSSTTITATTPAGSGGPLSVRVTNADGQSAVLLNAFVYVSITAISPNNGPASGGTTVTLTGTGFLTGATVTFGGTAATVNSLTGTQIVVTAPAHTAGAVTVVVTNTSGTNGTGTYTFNPPPTISSISPNSGSTLGGTVVTVTGTGFLAGANVSLSGSLLILSSVTSTQIVGTTQSHVAGAVNVTVTNPDVQSATLPGGFTYVPPPTVSSVSPNAGSSGGGTFATVTGTGFLAGATVTLGGTLLTGVTVVSSTTITGTTGAHAVGLVTVVVTNTDGQSGSRLNGYTYSSAPTVTAISPNNGTTGGGTLVTITGTNFIAGATADLGGSALTSVSVVSATSLVGRTTTHAAGVVAVRVTNPGGFSASLAGAFTYVLATNAQTAAYVWDTSAGINYARRWYIDFSFSAFTTDLVGAGLQTGTPSDTVNLYALDWMRAYVLRTMNIAYGRNGNGTKIAGTSINVTFVGLAPATGTAGGTGANDYSRICVGGCEACFNAPGCAGPTVGVAIFDAGNPCGQNSENNCSAPQFGGAGCRGSFPRDIRNAWGQTLNSYSGTGNLSTTDQQYLDGTTNSGTRYNAIHGFMQQFARRIAFVTAHECGHSHGLCGMPLTGSCGSAAGQCGASGSHNNCCSNNIMSSSLNIGGTFTDTSEAFSGQPGGVTAGSGCWSASAASSWAMLQSFIGTSP